MKLVTYNVQYGKGKDGRFDLARIAGEVAGADVIALQEVERHWQRSGLVDQPAKLLEHLDDDYHWVYGAGVDLDGGGPAGPAPRRRQFGNMLLSKTPILWARHHLLPKQAVLGPPLSLQRSALEGAIQTAVGAIRVVCVHLCHLSEETRMPQVEALLAIHERAAFEGAPLTGGAPDSPWIKDGLPEAMPRLAILLGDFNFEVGSREYRRVVGGASDYGGRLVHPEGFVDAWEAAGRAPTEGITGDIRGVPARLDYAFVSTGLADRIQSVRIDGAAQGSDHQPVWLEIDL